MSADSLRIDQAWVDALGLPREEIAGLSLRAFIELCSDRGITPVVEVADPPIQSGLYLKSGDNPSLSPKGQKEE